jgi:hypothetical protein
MCTLQQKSKHLFMTMIRQECINFRSLPATIALEQRAEPHNALGAGGGGLYTGATNARAKSPSFDDFESFPVIEWNDDDEENIAPVQMGWNARDVLAGGGCQSLSIGRKHHKRAKLSSDPFLVTLGSDSANGLLRSKRISSMLHQLEDQIESKSATFTPQPQDPCLDSHLEVPFRSSFFTTTKDVNLEKMLQISFCSEESNQVMLVG